MGSQDFEGTALEEMVRTKKKPAAPAVMPPSQPMPVEEEEGIVPAPHPMATDAGINEPNAPQTGIS